MVIQSGVDGSITNWERKQDQSEAGGNQEGRRCCEESVLSTGRPWGGPANLGLM